MLFFAILLVYGLVVGWIAELLNPVDAPRGMLSTILVGIAGSYVGGFLHFLLFGGGPLRMSGLLFGVIGGVIFLSILRWVRFNMNDKRYFFSGRIKE